MRQTQSTCCDGHRQEALLFAKKLCASFDGVYRVNRYTLSSSNFVQLTARKWCRAGSMATSLDSVARQLERSRLLTCFGQRGTSKTLEREGGLDEVPILWLVSLKQVNKISRQR